MRMIDLAKTLAKLTPEQMTVLATHLTYWNYDQADRMQNYLYAQIVDATEAVDFNSLRSEL